MTGATRGDGIEVGEEGKGGERRVERGGGGEGIIAYGRMGPTEGSTRGPREPEQCPNGTAKNKIAYHCSLKRYSHRKAPSLVYNHRKKGLHSSKFLVIVY